VGTEIRCTELQGFLRVASPPFYWPKSAEFEREFIRENHGWMVVDARRRHYITPGQASIGQSRHEVTSG
jgi:hypothetical protein